jgi:LmbE family N-acetylglucosaminyl deacetylase
VYLTYHRPERTHELLDGLWTVGVTAYPVIGPFADSISTKDSLMAAEAAFGRESVVEFQVEMLRRFKPAVVVGQDLDGEYGHGAHMLNARTLAEALELSGDATNYPHSAALYGVWDVPKAYLHLYPENQIVMDWNLPLAHFNGKTAFEMAEAGFAMHKSQTGDFAVQQSGTWQDCRKFGLYRTTVGPDIKKDDLFENIL